MSIIFVRPSTGFTYCLPRHGGLLNKKDETDEIPTIQIKYLEGLFKTRK